MNTIKKKSNTKTVTMNHSRTDVQRTHEAREQVYIRQNQGNSKIQTAGDLPEVGISTP